VTSLRDPETCPRCKIQGRVIDSKKRVGYRRRLYRCRTCKVTWPAFLSIINPRRVRQDLTAY
jgi:hypothetical protein